MKFETYAHKIVVYHQPNFHKDPCTDARARGINARTRNEMRTRAFTLTVSTIQPSTVRTATYSLNKEKQISRLAKNATLNHFEIEVTGPTNVNIQCSSGFYQLVAKPILSSLLLPSFFSHGVHISCTDNITPKLDNLRRDVNVVLHFKVSQNDSQESATVHLHHTQQKVQVQGRAAPWFVDFVLKERFSSEAKNKELSIKNLNSRISRPLTNHQAFHTDQVKDNRSSCRYCGVNFRSNSKASSCSKCHQTFHNSKVNPCLPRHSCSAANSHSNIATASPALALAISSSASIFSSSSSIPATASNPSCGSTVSGISQSIPSTTASFNQISTLTVSSASTSTYLTSSTTSTSTGPSVPIPSLSVSGVSQPCSGSVLNPPSNSGLSPQSPEFVQGARVRAKKATSNKSIDQKDVENDFLKRELNIVKVHLLEKEAEVKDLSKKNKVLAEMVKILENKTQREINDRNKSSSQVHMNVPTTCCSNATGFTSRPSTDIIQPDMVNKLLNFLVDLNLKFCNDRTNSHSTSSNISEPTVIPSPSQDCQQPCQDAITPNQVPDSLQPQVVAENVSLDDSAMTFDEFAPGLSQESFSQVLDTLGPVESSPNHLNSKIQTNQ